MICNFVLGLCVVGGMQVGPGVYQLEIIDAGGTVHKILTKMSEVYTPMQGAKKPPEGGVSPRDYRK